MTLITLVLFLLFAVIPNVFSLPFQGIGVPVTNVDAKNIISGCYIVVYQDNATDSAIASHQAVISKAINKHNKRSKTGASASMKSFAISKLKGFSIEAGDDIMMSMADSSEIAYIEADTKVFANALVTQANAPAGLRRLSHQAVGSTDYVYDSSAGSGITAYVVDTGININHTEFNGRATMGVNFVNSVNTDENGHGTHCAGTIAGTTYGVAKSAKLVGVKVLDADGCGMTIAKFDPATTQLTKTGSTSAVIAGINWVTSAATNPAKSVINISIAGSASTAMNAAVAAAVTAGITTVVAAGNEAVDASADSPASEVSAITVGAIDNNDTKASFSNYGTTVDVFAPGVKILSAYIGSNNATKLLSGTSMASPHIAGLSAYLMSLNESLTTPALVSARIKQLAVAGNGTVKSAGTGSPKLIAYNGSGA